MLHKFLSKIKYELIINDDLMGTVIEFYDFDEKYCKHVSNDVIVSYIETNLHPILRLTCYTYDDAPEIYEMVITYILINIGTYDKICFDYNARFNETFSTLYFDITNKEILLKLL